MFIVIKEACLISVHDFLVVGSAQFSPWLKELGLLHMGPVDLIQLPIVSIRVDDATILNAWVHIAHVFQSPDA